MPHKFEVPFALLSSAFDDGFGVSPFALVKSVHLDCSAVEVHGTSYTVVRSIQPGRSEGRAYVEVRTEASPGGSVSMIVQDVPSSMICRTLGWNFTCPLAKVNLASTWSGSASPSR